MLTIRQGVAIYRRIKQLRIEGNLGYSSISEEFRIPILDIARYLSEHKEEIANRVELEDKYLDLFGDDSLSH